jgi:hypothetical protein
MLRSVLSCVSALRVLGCGGAARNLMLQDKAAAELQCSKEQLTQTEIDHAYFQKVAGCSKENLYAYDPAQDKWVSPLERASFDLSCPRESLVAKHLGARDVGVEGCGKKSVYVLSASGAGWIANP